MDGCTVNFTLELWQCVHATIDFLTIVIESYHFFGFFAVG